MKKLLLPLSGLFLLLAGLFVLSLAMGSVTIPLWDVWASLTGGIPQKPTSTTIIWQFRLPKAIAATLTGAALSVSGLQIQTLFQNPLAGPYVLGVSSGASLGVALLVLATNVTGISLSFGTFSTAIAACLGAASVMILVVLVSRLVTNSVSLLVLGLLFGYITNAVVSLLIYFSNPQQIQTYLTWTFGSFGNVTWSQIPIFAIAVLIGLSVSIILSRSLNLLLLGESQARTLGLSLSRVRLLIIVNVSLLAGIVTAFCGPIAFLGVAVPHLGRSLLRSTDHRVLMPIVLLLGSCLALFADWVAQTPGNQIVLPLNSVTALVGAPVIVWIILRRRSTMRN
ncbi:iron ABC transporter permease [Pseudanabaenaceae cyanobacterium LEGE 13415]|nr:iron ABC transporter permease [Pseudanabaenaceae cyanobacterium LEGE 13415]